MMTIKQQGVTLIELMIGIVIGLIVVAGGISFYVATIQGSTNTHRSTHLTQDSNAIMQLTTNEIRRAGYGVEISNLAVPNNACVLYVYDANEDGDIDAGDNEHHGFKRSVTNGIGRIEMKTVGNSMADCAAGTWVSLSDDEMIDVTAFTVTNTVTNLTGVDVRQITLTLDSESVSDSIINKSDTVQIHLRNHNFP
jgi:prepilin peptidase dependent protein B